MQCLHAPLVGFASGVSECAGSVTTELIAEKQPQLCSPPEDVMASVAIGTCKSVAAFSAVELPRVPATAWTWHHP